MAQAGDRSRLGTGLAQLSAARASADPTDRPAAEVIGALEAVVEELGVTEHELTERKALRYAEADPGGGWAGALDGCGVGVLLTDPHGRMGTSNEVALGMLPGPVRPDGPANLAARVAPGSRTAVRHLLVSVTRTAAPACGLLQLAQHRAVHCRVLPVPTRTDPVGNVLWLLLPPAADEPTGSAAGLLDSPVWDLLSRPHTTDPTEDVLMRAARFSLLAIPGATGTSVTLVDPASAGPSDERVGRADRLQYALLEGPCVDALRTRELQVAGELSGDTRWPRFGPQVVQHAGYRSALAVPLDDGTITVGVLNAYADEPEAFDDDAVRLAVALSAPSAAALADMHRHGREARLAAQLSEAMASRAVIEQAKGILMAREGIDAEAAFARLVDLSQHRNRKLRLIATDLVADVTAGTAGTRATDAG